MRYQKISSGALIRNINQKEKVEVIRPPKGFMKFLFDN
jgi:hypothetical protein